MNIVGCAILSHSNPATDNGFDILRKELSLAVPILFLLASNLSPCATHGSRVDVCADGKASENAQYGLILTHFFTSQQTTQDKLCRK